MAYESEDKLQKVLTAEVFNHPAFLRLPEAGALWLMQISLQ